MTANKLVKGSKGTVLIANRRYEAQTVESIIYISAFQGLIM